MAGAVGEPAIDPREPTAIPTRARYAPELIKDRELASVQGSPPDRTSSSDIRTTRLPILMYHRVAPTGALDTSRYRVDPKAFEGQLRWLRDGGYRTLGLEEWCDRMLHLQPIAGPAVLLTFDDGCRDFALHAWPLLSRYGLGATLFVVTDLVGQTNSWDASYGESVPLLSWQELAHLRDEGVQIESHSSRHARLTGLDTVELAKDLARSRTALSQRLGVNSRAIAYPHGDADPAVRQIAGACGFRYGLSTWAGISGPGDDPLWLPRVEIAGSDSIEVFAAKVRGDWKGQ
jgi:peptidoglycan/xylan/chitin deacetylase (PgdA/CDA1 family)